MLSRLRNMFRVADLRNKILFTLVIIAIYRLGSHLPLPYVDFSAIQALKDRAAHGAARVLLIVTTLTAGTAMIMWLGELITQRGIGNGMSLLIFSSVVSRLPAQGSAIWATGNYFQFATVILMGVGMIVGIIFVEQGQRRIPVHIAQRVVGRRVYGGQRTYIPLKVNQSGVIPIIFASSVLYFPALITGILPWAGVQTWVQNSGGFPR